MIVIDPVVARLRERAAKVLRFVGGAVDLAAAQDDIKQVPAAFVLPMSEEAGQNEIIGGVQQAVRMRFAVMVAIRNVADPRGEAAIDELVAARSAVLDALINWLPAGATQPIEFGGGQVAAVTDRYLWWQDEFTTNTYLRSV